MRSKFPYTQIRIALPTDQLDRLLEFYTKGLDLNQIGHFRDREGFSGIVLGMPTESYHLEFTQHNDGSPCHALTRDNLLVFYLENSL